MGDGSGYGYHRLLPSISFIRKDYERRSKQTQTPPKKEAIKRKREISSQQDKRRRIKRRKNIALYSYAVKPKIKGVKGMALPYFQTVGRRQQGKVIFKIDGSPNSAKQVFSHPKKACSNKLMHRQNLILLLMPCSCI